MTTTAIPAGFVIPGNIDLPTGGYAYDRRVLALLPRFGVDIQHVALPGSFPGPDSSDLEASERMLAALPPDLPLLIDGLALGAIPSAMVARIRQPIVALCHHPLALEAGLSELQQTHFRTTETAALALARHVIATSAMTGRTLTAEFGVPEARLTIAEPGTDPAARAAGSAASAGAPLQLLAVGSIVPRKGYDVLVAALTGLQDRPWRLTIAGSNDRDPQTTCANERLITDAGFDGRISMIGAVGPAQLDRLYDGADIFVMPSLFEGYGMVLAEAMARGLPIVCTTGGAAAETAPDSAALKVPPGDAGAFRVAVARVLDNQAERRSMSDASWIAGQTLPRWCDTARIIADVLKKVTA